MERFQTNSDIHSTNTTHKHDLHMLNVNLTSYWKYIMQGASYVLLFDLTQNVWIMSKYLSHHWKMISYLTPATMYKNLLKLKVNLYKGTSWHINIRQFIQELCSQISRTVKLQVNIIFSSPFTFPFWKPTQLSTHPWLCLS